jgi:uncharacterized short protein YbdD (DUF466 family)
MSPSTAFAERLRARMRLRGRLASLWRFLAQTGRLIVGVPDYDLYVAHVRRVHPDRTPMSREAFFAERMQARYGRGASRCC